MKVPYVFHDLTCFVVFLPSDINECEEDKDLVCQNGRCKNTVGSFICDCQQGFTKTADGRNCRGYFSILPRTVAGYDYLTPSSKLIRRFEPLISNPSSDVNECKEFDGMCINGVCRNADGDFRCSCSEGYKPGPEGHDCVDIDECDEVSLLCDGGICLNLEGGFRCICPPGYMLSIDQTDCLGEFLLILINLIFRLPT